MKRKISLTETTFSSVKVTYSRLKRDDDKNTASLLLHNFQTWRWERAQCDAPPD